VTGAHNRNGCCEKTGPRAPTCHAQERRRGPDRATTPANSRQHALLPPTRSQRGPPLQRRRPGRTPDHQAGASVAMRRGGRGHEGTSRNTRRKWNSGRRGTRRVRMPPMTDSGGSLRGHVRRAPTTRHWQKGPGSARHRSEDRGQSTSPWSR